MARKQSFTISSKSRDTALSPSDVGFIATPTASNSTTAFMNIQDEGKDPNQTVRKEHPSKLKKGEKISASTIKRRRMNSRIINDSMIGDRHSQDRPFTSVGMVYKPSTRERLQAILNSKTGVYLDIINCLLSLIACIMYLFEVYEFAYNEHVYQNVELAMSIYFLIDFIIHVHAADDRCAYVFSFMGIIDIITIIPAYVMLFVDTAQLDAVMVFRVLRVFRALRILRLYRLVHTRKSGYQHELSVLIFSISALIFVAAGVIHAVELQEYNDMGEELYFHDMLYFVLVTVSTVGYGDITPKSIEAQFLVMALIVAIVTIVPPQISKLTELAKTNKDYNDAFEPNKRKRYQGHVIVTGSVNESSISHFLEEFYHSARGLIKLHVVILGNNPPSPQLERLIKRVEYADRTVYLRGSLLNNEDQERVKLRLADSVFLIANKDSRTPQQDDASTILKALSVKNYADVANKTIRVYIQLSTDRKFQLAPMVGAYQTVNSVKLNSAILARTTLCAGSSTLITNLLRSSSPQKFAKAGVMSMPWIQEYVNGMSNQIYPILLSEKFEGQTFYQAAWNIYHRFNVLLIALYNRQHTISEPKVILCPLDATLHENDLCFIIATNSSVGHRVTSNYVDHTSGPATVTPSPRIPENFYVQVTTDSLLRPISPKKKSSHLAEIFEPLQASTPRDSCEDEVRGSEEAAPYTDSYSSTNSSSSACSSSYSSPTQEERFQGDNTLHQRKKSYTDPFDSFEKAVRTSLHDIKDHILLIGPIESLKPVFKLLRKFHIHMKRALPPVVFFLSKLPTLEDWKQLGCPRAVYFLLGEPTKCEDLLLAGALRAKKVLMLPEDQTPSFLNEFKVKVESDPNEDEGEEHLIDYGIIMSLLCFETVCSIEREMKEEPNGLYYEQSTCEARSIPRNPSVYEKYFHELDCGLPMETVQAKMIDECPNTNPSLLRDRRSSSSSAADVVGHLLQRSDSWRVPIGPPADAAGETQSCFPKYNKMLSTVAVIKRRRNMRFCRPRDPCVDMTADEMMYLTPAYAAGSVYVTAMLDLLVSQSYFNPYLTEIIHLLAGDPLRSTSDLNPFSNVRHKVDSATSSAERSVEDRKDLVLLDIPSSYIGERFGDLFDCLINQDCLAVGFYRAVNNSLGNILPFVMTCPLKDTVINVGDQVYVIGSCVEIAARSLSNSSPVDPCDSHAL